MIKTEIFHNDFIFLLCSKYFGIFVFQTHLLAVEKGQSWKHIVFSFYGIGKDNLIICQTQGGCCIGL